MGNGMHAKDAWLNPFNENNPMNNTCVKIMQETMRVWTSGQNCPPVSYAGS
jgi:hypothetical protein